MPSSSSTPLPPLLPLPLPLPRAGLLLPGGTAASSATRWSGSC